MTRLSPGSPGPERSEFHGLDHAAVIRLCQFGRPESRRGQHVLGRRRPELVLMRRLPRGHLRMHRWPEGELAQQALPRALAYTGVRGQQSARRPRRGPERGNNDELDHTAAIRDRQPGRSEPRFRWDMRWERPARSVMQLRWWSGYLRRFHSTEAQLTTPGGVVVRAGCRAART